MYIGGSSSAAGKQNEECTGVCGVSEAGRLEGPVTGGNLNFDASSSWKRNESKSKLEVFPARSKEEGVDRHRKTSALQVLGGSLLSRSLFRSFQTLKIATGKLQSQNYRYRKEPGTLNQDLLLYRLFDVPAWDASCSDCRLRVATFDSLAKQWLADKKKAGSAARRILSSEPNPAMLGRQ